ncbi:hypothetical protein BJY04DRAFT_213459 [Aspergillus karnatakaensis]|uniref:uncharacterized protein n=1 Tax=Aspergillus karnatakaensis TaxID=1810916 RepID=UPI003CCDAAB0
MAPLTRDNFFRHVPQTWNDWHEAARALHVSRTSINTVDDLESGSHTTQAQYLVYRVLRPETLPYQMINLQALNIQAEHGQAVQWLGQFAPFRAYIQSIAAGANTTTFTPGAQDPYDLGLFEHPRREQQLALGQILPVTVDEDTVNTGLLSFLASTLMKYPANAAEWLIHRIALRANFTKAGYEARVDGYLASATKETKIVLEAKRAPRSRIEPKVSMQETSEVLALLQQETVLMPAANRPVLVSQDEQYIYLSLATYNQRYIDYLKGANGAMSLVAKDHFMKVQLYGPWSVASAGDMENFARLILAIALKYGQ